MLKPRLYQKKSILLVKSIFIMTIHHF